MHNILEEYDSVVGADENFLCHLTNPLTIKTLRDHLHSKWEKIEQQKKITVNNNDDEAFRQALIAGSQFKGHCSFCGKI